MDFDFTTCLAFVLEGRALRAEGPLLILESHILNIMFVLHRISLSPDSVCNLLRGNLQEKTEHALKHFTVIFHL